MLGNPRYRKTTISAWSPRFARPGDSWWSIVHKFAAFNGLRGPATRDLLRLDMDSIKCVGDNDDLAARSPHLQLESSTGSSRASARFVPLMILNEFGARHALHEELRFCEDCLSVGFHSPVYQVRYVQRCPIHNADLRSRCPQCGRKISMSCSNNALAHAYACQCGHSFLMDVAKTGMRALVRELDTSPITEWQSWANSWGREWVLKEFASEPRGGIATAWHARRKSGVQRAVVNSSSSRMGYR